MAELFTLTHARLTQYARICDLAAPLGLTVDLEFPSFSRITNLQEAADIVGCQVAQIAKSLVFREKTTGEPILVVASGANRVDLKKIEAATGLKLGRADGNYVKQQVGFAIGGIPPAGHTRPLETILDPDLQRFDTIWAAAGTPFAVFQLKPADLEPLTHGRWIPLREES